MATANAFSLQATLNIQDHPLGYQPPVGPAIDFKANYNHLEANMPTSFTFTNLGQDWTFNWVSYLTVSAGTATLRLPGGGSETYTVAALNVPSTPDPLSQAVLVNTGTNAFQRIMPDGSMLVYNQADTSTPPRVFMTEDIDPQANSVLIQYDANFRISTITDAIGQVSTLTYASTVITAPGYYEIATITDPFSRSCNFTWDTATSLLLLSITDVIGLKSKFAYDTSSSFISQMTTPYGTTAFYQYIPADSNGTLFPVQGLKFTFPDGTSSYVESWFGTVETTFYWDRHATQMYPNEPDQNTGSPFSAYTHSQQTSWVINSTGVLTEPVPQTATQPLETASPTSYLYPGQSVPHQLGTVNKPSQVSRPLGNPITIFTVGGTVTTSDVLQINASNNGLAD
jgi:hypothetical protein